MLRSRSGKQKLTSGFNWIGNISPRYVALAVVLATFRYINDANTHKALYQQ